MCHRKNILPLDDDRTQRREHHTGTEDNSLKALVPLIEHIALTLLATADQISVKLLIIEEKLMC